jgi:hypothetical protein
VTHNFLTLRGEKREVYTTVKGRREQLARITALEEWCEKRSSSWWQQVRALPHTCSLTATRFFLEE